MYIATIPNRGSPPAILLREGYREGGQVKNRTLANLTHWVPDKVDLLRRLLRGEALAPVGQLFEVVASPHHGHVQAVRSAMQRVGFDTLIAARPSRERELVVAMVAARILEPDSTLATTRWWHTTTPPHELGVSDADEDDLHEAMDWLLARQERIEQKLAARHLTAGGLVLALSLAFAFLALALGAPTARAAREQLQDLVWDFQLVPLDSQTPPPFTLESLDGTKVALAGFRGRPVLLYFWHST